MSALQAFELQLIQKPVVTTTGRGCASPFGLKLKSRPFGLRGRSRTAVELHFSGTKVVLEKACQYRIFNTPGLPAPPRPPVDEAAAAAAILQMRLMMANALLRSGRAHLDDKDAAAALPELIQAVSMARTFLSPEQLKEYSETLERCQAVLAEQAK